MIPVLIITETQNYFLKIQLMAQGVLHGALINYTTRRPPEWYSTLDIYCRMNELDPIDREEPFMQHEFTFFAHVEHRMQTHYEEMVH